MQHLIRKQIVNLQLSRQMDAFSMQQSISRHYWKEVLPLFEKVFDELTHEEELIRIDRLEIDLGCISIDEMKKENWPADILLRISKQLKEKMEISAEGKSYVRERNAVNICRQWLFYMQEGYLPWNTLKITDAWYKQVLEELAGDFSSVAALRKLILEKPQVGRRITLQHKTDFLVSLIEILTAENQVTLVRAMDELKEIFSHAGNLKPRLIGSHDISKVIWEQCICLSATGSKLTTRHLVQSILLENIPDHAMIARYIKDHGSSLPLILPILNELQSSPSLYIESKARLSQKAETPVRKEKPGYEEIDEEGIFVQHAGLVLVHPFLPELFKHLKLTREGKFIDDYQQLKAMYLLHYMATGNVEAEEFELAVPKLLCSWPGSKPVEKDVIISEELLESDNMLMALVEHWSVLKNTTVDGLREGFLQRNGKLFRKKEKLNLQVEHKTIDVLLDQLPWNLGMIKLPWMNELLWVEWR